MKPKMIFFTWKEKQGYFCKKRRTEVCDWENSQLRPMNMIQHQCKGKKNENIDE
jgi:hypothetical protein